MDWNLRVLAWIQSVRTPFLDGFFTAVTGLGEETVLVPLFCILFWCVGKRAGYQIGLAFFSGAFVSQILKITFCVARPWRLSTALQPVKSAVAGASGFSFPSGHTTGAVGIYGAIAHVWKKRFVAVPMGMLILLVACSRLYLGVHTPLDVGAALLVGVAALLAAPAVLTVAETREKGEWIVLTGGVLLCVLGLIFTYFRTQRYGGGDTELFWDAYKAVGGGLGFFAARFVEVRYVRFTCKAPLWFQGVKAISGLLLLLLLQQGLKTPFLATFGAEAGHGLRYFVVVFFAIAVHPWLFTCVERRINMTVTGTENRDGA